MSSTRVQSAGRAMGHTSARLDGLGLTQADPSPHDQIMTSQCPVPIRT